MISLKYSHGRMTGGVDAAAATSAATTTPFNSFEFEENAS
jgi:hypothetical protein